MDTVFGIIIVVFFLLMVLGPMLRRLFAPLISRWLMGKQEDFMRRMMGMPTRKEERRRRREAARNRSGRGQRHAGPEATHSAHASRHVNEAIDFMRTVAEDVEFTETKNE